MLISYPKNSNNAIPSSQRDNENAFLVFHIPSGKGAGDCVDSGGGAVGDSTGELCSFTGDAAGGGVNGVSAGKMLHKSWQFVLRKPI